MRPLVIILMGVSGVGKTTVGRRLAHDLGWPFYDGDDFHPRANIEKMRQGIALNDADRAAWLTALQQLIHDLIHRQQSAVIACSALKQAYRDRLGQDREEVRFVYLKGSFDLIRSRVQKRRHRFMPSTLLASQFATLEEPQEGLTVEVIHPPGTIVNRIKQALGLAEKGHKS